MWSGRGVLWERMQETNALAANVEDNDNWETRKARVAEFLEGVKSYKEGQSHIPAVLSLAFAMLCEQSAPRGPQQHIC